MGDAENETALFKQGIFDNSMSNIAQNFVTECNAV